MDRPTDEPLIDGLPALPEGSFDDLEPDVNGAEAVYARTARVIRGYRWRRRIRLAAALLLAFVAGGLAGAEFLGGRSPAEPPVHVASTHRTPESVPRDLEDRARTATPEARGGLLRRAGDGYLSAAESDPLSAVRCYEQLLDEDSGSTAKTDDSWLLLYLKLARP